MQVSVHVDFFFDAKENAEKKSVTVSIDGDQPAQTVEAPVSQETVAISQEETVQPEPSENESKEETLMAAS